MKRISAFLPLLLCLGAGVARWLDLVNYTDLSTGFSAAGPYWLRYLLLAGVLLTLALFSLTVARCPASLYRGSILCGGLCLVSGLLFAALGGTTLSDANTALRAPNGAVLNWILGSLYIVTSYWLLSVGFSRMGRKAKEPSRHVMLGILGTVAFLLLTFREGLSEAANIQRITVVWNALGALAALWFGVRMIRACYLPDTPAGRGLFLSGYTCFLMNTCLLLPQQVCLWLTGSAAVTIFDLIQAVAYGVFGLVSLTFAVTASLGEETEE